MKVLNPKRLQADVSSKQNPLITRIWLQHYPLLFDHATNVQEPYKDLVAKNSFQAIIIQTFYV